MSAQREMITATLGSFAIRLVGLASTFALGVLLARVLGPADYGRYGLVTTLALLGVTVAHLGTPQLAVRELSVRTARGDAAGVCWIVRRFLAVTTIAALILAAVAILIAIFAFQAQGRDLLLIALGAMLTPVMTIGFLIASQLRGLGSLVKGQFFEVAGRPVLILLAALAVLYFGLRLDAVVALWLQLAVAAVAVIVSIKWLLQVLPAAAPTGPSNPEERHWLRAALPLGAVDVLRQLDGSYGIILMGWLASDAELGVFRVAVACAALLGMPSTIFHIVLAPRVARLHGLGERDELQRLLAGVSLALVLVMLPVALLIALFGQPLIAAVFGSAYSDAWLPLFYLAIAQTIFGLFGMGPILLAMADGEAHLIKIYLVSVAAGVGSAIPLMDAYGAAGAAMAQIVSFGAIGFLSWRFARERMGLELTFLRLGTTVGRS